MALSQSVVAPAQTINHLSSEIAAGQQDHVLYLRNRRHTDVLAKPRVETTDGFKLQLSLPMTARGLPKNGHEANYRTGKRMQHGSMR